MISLDVERAFDKIQHSFMLKDLERSQIQVSYLNMIKAIYRKKITNINLKEKELKAVTLKSSARQNCLFSPYLFNIVLKVLATAIKEQKKIKRMHIVNEVKDCYLQMA